MTTDAYELAKAEVILIGYDSRWCSEMEHYRVLGVEQAFRAPLYNPQTGQPSRTWALGGKLDVTVLDLRTDLRNLVEHKTASGEVGPGSDYLKRLRLDGQVTVYYSGAESLGQGVDACIYDVLVKPALRPLKATPVEARKYTKTGALYANQREQDETPEEYRARLAQAVAEAPNDYYLRATVVRLEQEMRDGMADVWDLGRVMREAQLARRFPRNPDACVRYGRTCEFFGVCCGEESLDDLTKFRRSDVVHEELGSEEHDLLTTSRLSAFRACQRLHQLRYLEGYRPVREADNLRFGTLIHRGLEAWWRESNNDERLAAALDAVRNPVVPASMVGA